MTPLDQGIDMPIHNAQFNKDDFINTFVTLGAEVLDIMEFFKEFEKQ